VADVSSPSRVVIATAGHVDHGKTALIQALTGVDTDRLPEEKLRGISIELGFAQLAGHGISFIDVPGHKKLVHAMIAGVGGVDGALLVVAADDGVMPQTREHLWVCALLGIERLVVALSKADLVDAEMLELAEADVRATLDELGLTANAIIATSAVTKRGLPELERALVELTRSVPARGESSRLWLPVDRVFSIKGAGTVVTGTLARGQVSVGDPLYVAGERGTIEASCRALEIHGAFVQTAQAPARLALNLARVDLSDIHRGDVVTKDRALPRSRHVAISLRALPGTEHDLEDGSPVIVHAGTTRRAARITRYGDAAAQLALATPLPAEGGVGVVLRGFRSTRQHGAVLGGGRIVDAAPRPPPKRRAATERERRAALIAAAARRELGDAIGILFELSGPRPLEAADVERRFGLEPGELSRVLVGKKRKGPADAIALPGGELFTTARIVDELLDALERQLGDYHAAHPHDPGAPRETLRARLSVRAGRELTELVLQRAVSSARLRQVGAAALALPSFAEHAGAAGKQVATRLLRLLEDAALEGLSESAIAARSGEKLELVRASMAQLAAAGSARRLTEMWFAESELEKVRAIVRSHLAVHGSISVPSFKQITGVSRKQAIPLLEQLDREGTTRRQGDLRVLGARAS
jgi:selenocysteine-specific elongation factor